MILQAGLDLLASLNATNIRTRTKSNGETEIHCDCLSHITGHVQDSGNSASLNIDKELFSCFSCGAGFNVPQLLLYGGEAYSWGDALTKSRRYVEALPEEWEELKFDAVEYGETKPEWWQPEMDAMEVMAFVRKGHTYLTNPREEGGRGVPKEVWKSLGVHYVPPRDAIRFPCVDHVGRLVGYIDRPFHPLSDNKYLNSPGPWRNYCLYGYFHALKALRSGKFDYVWVVEGPGDLAALHALGYTNAVATLGVKCSQFQIDLLSRMTQNILLAYDNDKWGFKATNRFLDMAEGRFKKIRIGKYVGNFHDPGEFTLDIAELFVEQAQSPIERSLAYAKYRRAKKAG